MEKTKNLWKYLKNFARKWVKILKIQLKKNNSKKWIQLNI